MGRLGLALRSLRGNLLTATDGRDILHNSPNGWEVEQPWLWWTGPGGPFGNPPPGAGVPDNATSIPAVARATGLVVDPITVMPWNVYRDETEKLPTPAWLSDPQGLRVDGRLLGSSVDDVRMSRIDFWGQWITSALWFGDGLVYVPVRGTDGAPRPPLFLLNPNHVQVRDGGYWVGEVRVDGSEIIHLRRPPIVSGRGTGILSQFSADFVAAQSQRSYAASAFASGVPAGYLKTTSPNMTQEQADALKSRWMATHGGTARSIAVLNATTEFHPLTWSPVDLAATEFAQMTLGQIALMFGIPAYLLGAPTDSNTYANVESRMLELYQLAWLPQIGRIEAVLDAQLPAGTEVKVKMQGMLRADFQTRTAGYKILVELGVMTIDEVRQLEDLPPLPQEVLVG